MPIGKLSWTECVMTCPICRQAMDDANRVRYFELTVCRGCGSGQIAAVLVRTTLSRCSAVVPSRPYDSAIARDPSCSRSHGLTVAQAVGPSAGADAMQSNRITRATVSDVASAAYDRDAAG